MLQSIILFCQFFLFLLHGLIEELFHEFSFFLALLAEVGLALWFNNLMVLGWWGLKWWYLWWSYFFLVFSVGSSIGTGDWLGVEVFVVMLGIFLSQHGLNICLLLGVLLSICICIFILLILLPLQHILNILLMCLRLNFILHNLL